MKKYVMSGLILSLVIGLGSMSFAARRWVCGPSGCSLVETVSPQRVQVQKNRVLTPVISNNAVEYIITNTVVENSLVAAVDNDVCKCEDCKCAVSPVISQEETVVTQTYQTVVVKDNYSRAKVLPRVASRARELGGRIRNALSRVRFWRR
jgi:hypothetical protein